MFRMARVCSGKQFVKDHRMYHRMPCHYLSKQHFFVNVFSKPLFEKHLPSTSQRRFAVHQPFTLKTVESRILLVLRLYDKIDSSKLTMDSDFFKDLGLDSLDFVELIMEIEDEFMFEIPDGDSDRIRTPNDIKQYICDKYDVIS